MPEDDDSPDPEWLIDEGFSDILEYKMGYTEEDRIFWALSHGICIGQPFLVAFDAPVFTCDYFGEWDSTQDYRVIRLAPKKTSSKELSWDQVFKRIEQGRLRFAKFQLGVLNNHLLHPKGWKLQFSSYTEGHYGPTQYWVSLVSMDKGSCRNLAESSRIKDVTPDKAKEAAFNSLLEHFKNRFPQIDPGPLLTLAKDPNRVFWC